MTELGKEWEELKAAIDVLYKLVKGIESGYKGKSDGKISKKSDGLDKIINITDYKSRDDFENQTSSAESYKNNGQKKYEPENRTKQENYNAEYLLKVLEEKLNDEKMKSEKNPESLDDIMNHARSSGNELEKIEYLISRMHNYPKQISEILYKDYIHTISQLPRSEKNDNIVYKTLVFLSDHNQHLLLEDKDELLMKMDEERWNLAGSGKREEQQKAPKRKFFGFMF